MTVGAKIGSSETGEDILDGDMTFNTTDVSSDPVTNEAVISDEAIIPETDSDGGLATFSEDGMEEYAEVAAVQAVLPSVTYRTHVQNTGWESPVTTSSAERIAQAGTTGRSLRLEAIRINISGVDNLGIEYKTHVQNEGWESKFTTSNNISGTSGKSLRLEAIQIRLTGSAASKYDVYYRVHCQNIGWMGWAKNGESAGTASLSYRLEGIQVQLVSKGQEPPGSTANSFSNHVHSWVAEYGTKVVSAAYTEKVPLRAYTLLSEDGLPVQSILVDEKGNKTGYFDDGSPITDSTTVSMHYFSGATLLDLDVMNRRLNSALGVSLDFNQTVKIHSFITHIVYSEQVSTANSFDLNSFSGPAELVSYLKKMDNRYLDSTITDSNGRTIQMRDALDTWGTMMEE